MTGHLLHIGYPKAGSTFLQRWFETHPQLLYSPGGVAGFRDVYSVARAAAVPAGDERYRVTSDERFTAPRADAGDFVVDYRRDGPDPAARQARACDLLYELFPSAPC